MEIRITSKQILGVLHVFSWIIFAGLCVEAGGVLVNTAITACINPAGVRNFWQGREFLTALLQWDYGYFLVITGLMIIVAVLKSLLFYQIIKLFTEKKMALSQPFNSVLVRGMSLCCWMALGIGLFAHAGQEYVRWLTPMVGTEAALEAMHLDGADVWLFMAVVLMLITQVIKRGVAMQAENELTI